MLSLSELVRIYVCLTPTDMRKSFDSLAALVREGLGYDPLSGHLFVFRSRRGDRVKLLWWDRGGLALYYRRLEKGTFHMHLLLKRLYGSTSEKLDPRQGVDLSRQTMDGWWLQTAEFFRPLYLSAVKVVLGSHVLHTDDTPVKIRDALAAATGCSAAATAEAVPRPFISACWPPASVTATTPGSTSATC